MMGATQKSDRPVMTGPDNSGACETCGQEAAIEIEGRGWCASCLHARGSCCGESEKDGCPD
jgi:hypothetical protein